MDHHALDRLKRTHPGWRLLCADHAPLIVGFLHHAFIQANLRALSRPDLVSRLEDYLHYLRHDLGDQALPRAAAAYLDEWAADDRGWLRKYYVAGNDEPHFDLTPATEKAIEWIAGLGKRPFVATESRLLTVFQLLRQMVEGTELDPAVRIAELEKRRAQIDAEIEEIRAGRLDLMDDTQVKDRFLQMAETARALLSDFREVEQNFRQLDRGVRERIAMWEGGKGQLLEDVFGEQDLIADSDQGKSFRAFWDFLMSAARQDELTTLLEAVFALAPVQRLAPDRRLLRVHYDWLEAGDATQRTVARLSEQLRRYLDDQVWLENRRIMQLLRGVEQHALALRNQPPEGVIMHLDEPAPEIALSMDRPLFAPPLRPKIAEQVVLAGDERLSADALFDQVYVDKTRLRAHIRQALQDRAQISLGEVVETHPLEQGLAELVSYLSVAADHPHALIDDGETQRFTWVDGSGSARTASLPLVVFARKAGA
jgi:hypothetical protein